MRGPSAAVLVQCFSDTGDCSEDKVHLKGRDWQSVRNTKQETSLTHLHRWITMRNSLSCQQPLGFSKRNICPWSYWNKWVVRDGTVFKGLLLSFIVLFYALKLYLQGFFISVKTEIIFFFFFSLKRRTFFESMCFQKMEFNIEQQLPWDV